MSRFPIVGAFFHPPAKALLCVLAIDTPLSIYAEPDNPADSNAIAVYLRVSDLSTAALEALPEQLEPFGMTLDGLREREIWHLGYVPKTLTARVREEVPSISAEAPTLGRFTLSSDGQARVTIGEA